MVYVVLTLAEACQKLVDDTVEGKLSVSELIQFLRDYGLNAAEAHDHVEEAQQRIHLQIAKLRQPNLPSHEPLPPREAAWEALRAKFEQAATSSVSTPTITIDQLAELLGEPKKPVGSTLIPQSLLSTVPHLALLQGKTADDPHIAKTWYFRQQYAKEKVVDSLINLGQSQALKDPISRAMWKLVILNHFVDLEKLYATLDKGYDHNDEPKDFMGGFSLVKKDFASAKKPVCTESDWTRAFDAWMAGVILFYPHREDKLSKYRSKIINFCQHIPNRAPIAIRFDADTHDHYTLRHLIWWAQNGVHRTISPHANNWLRSAKIGIWEFALWICAWAVVIIIFVANAMVPTRLEMLKNASRSLTYDDNNIDQAEVTDFVRSGVSRPKNQARLLVLWDAIGCPWKEKKQEFGEKLKIIGFWVDINQGTITLSEDSAADIVSKIESFIETPSRRPPLRNWQRLAGHLNWLLNVLPWGRPTLTEMYRKMSGKDTMHPGIYLNKEVIADMNWLIDIIPKSMGVRFLDTMRWHNSAADMVIWTDASLKLGMAFIYAGNGFAYQMAPEEMSTKIDIFFLELIAILSAIFHVALFSHPPRRLLIFPDSLDSVAVSNSLGASKSLHNSVRVKTTSGPIYYLDYFLMNIDENFPQTASANLSPLEVFCRCNGVGAFERVGWIIQAIEKSTASGYVTGACDYVKFCIKHNIPLDPTPQTLARFIAYTSRFIASGPKYLTGLRHFIRDFYPNFDNNRAHPIVQATIRGSKKVRADPIRRKQPLRPHHLTEFVNTARHTADLALTRPPSIAQGSNCYFSFAVRHHSVSIATLQSFTPQTCLLKEIIIWQGLLPNFSRLPVQFSNTLPPLPYYLLPYIHFISFLDLTLQ
ncbi:hypothetical protein E4T56_gene4054 [Termitomyces sp. T112]|nr:hypothetical protein E4T56_gene4054 [Termitomyces sp. T112]